MPIPNRRQLHVPLLHCIHRLGKGTGLHVRGAVGPMADQFKLTRKERKKPSANGQTTQLESEIRWSVSGLKNKHYCVESVGRGTYRCTKLGEKVVRNTEPSCEDIRAALKRPKKQGKGKKKKPNDATRRAVSKAGNLFEDYSATPETRFRKAVLNFLAGMEYWVQPVIDIRMPEGGDCFLFEMEHPHGQGRLCLGIVPQERITKPLLTATVRLMKKRSIRQVHLVMRKESEINQHARRQLGPQGDHDIRVVGFSDLAKHLIDNDLVMDLT